MAYRIYSFDGQLLPEYIQPGDTQNMGTGDALTGYLQLPGGGYYDQYRDQKSPQGIRPISKSCVIWGDDAEDAKDKLDALRSKIGVPGRLVVLYDDDSPRWQWARLRSVDAPRPEKAVGPWLPCRLSWETAAQWWYGIVQGEDWVVGDLSFLIGDGTAELDQNEFTFSGTGDGTTTDLHVWQNGNITARNVRIELTTDGPNTSYTLWNRTTGQYLIISPTYADGTIYIDAGSREAYEVDHSTPLTVATLYGQGSKIYVTTSGAHGLASGDDVRISGTGNYDGLYYAITVSDTTDFTVDIDPKSLLSGEEETTGTIEEFVDKYAALVAEDKMYWLSLAPGENVIDFGWVNTGSYSMTFRFYDHYA